MREPWGTRPTTGASRAATAAGASVGVPSTMMEGTGVLCAGTGAAYWAETGRAGGRGRRTLRELQVSSL